MKNILLAGKILSLSLAVSCAINAQEPGEQNDGLSEHWIGAFAHYYRADEEKFPTIQTYEEGDGFGFEYGYRFDPSWAARIELAKIKMDQGSLGGQFSGESVGVDMMYFLNESSTYVFGGLRYQDFGDSRRLATVGLGKHWHLNDQWAIVTELAGLHDFGEGHRDMLAKLGVSYRFANNTYQAKTVDQDADNDGVINTIDRCPATLANVPVTANGCAIVLDSDNDGVRDNIDDCPATPTGAKVDQTGCEIMIDTDKDGVIDDIDQCPATPTIDKVDEVGCSIFVEKEVTQTLRVFFASDNASVEQIDEASMQEFVTFLERYPNTDATIEGHASAPGAAAYNLRLSQQRAEAVKELLISKYKVNRDRLKTVGYGETQLLDTSNTELAHKTNRRITARVSQSVRTKLTK